MIESGTRASNLAQAATRSTGTQWPAWVFVLLLVVVLAPFWFTRVLHLLTGSPERSGRISGVWVGRAVLTQGSRERWDMPPEGEGALIVEFNAHARLLTSEDSVTGHVRVCSDAAATSSAQFDSGRLVNGVANLSLYQDPPSPSPITLDSAYISPRGDKLFYSGASSKGVIHGILHRATAEEFDRMCR